MKARSWQHWIFGSLAPLLLLLCAGLIWAAYQFRWQATGFLNKALWDWLQLLIIPAILAGGTLFFSWWNARTERQIAGERYEQDKALAKDKQREDLLESYLDRMSELLLKEGLRDSQPDDQVRKVARARTISTLIQLDGKRASTVFTFLHEAGLTEGPDPVISFRAADLGSVNWNEADLSKANLSGAKLMGANLSKANLSEINLSKANLAGASLSHVVLRKANLGGANLSLADLSLADLRETNLSQVDLSLANLSRALLSSADLSGAYLSEADLSGAYLSGALSEADLNKALLSRAWLTTSGAYLSEADVGKTQMSKTSLREQYLSQINLSGANLEGVQNLESAQLHKTDLRDVTGLTLEQRARCKACGAIIGEETMLKPSSPL